MALKLEEDEDKKKFLIPKDEEFKPCLGPDRKPLDVKAETTKPDPVKDESVAAEVVYHGAPETFAETLPALQDGAHNLVPDIIELTDEEEVLQDVESAPVDARPPKRRRVFMDAVVLPLTVGGRLPKCTDSEIEVLNEKMKKLKNSKAVKKQGLCFSLDTVRDRLLTVGLDRYPIDLDIDIQEVMVTRMFMSKTFGGGTQSAWVTIGEKYQRLHPYRDFLYLSLAFNCHAPEMPGSPGLYFSVEGRPADPIPGVYRLFTRIAATPRDGTLWQYQGQYELIPAPSLTTREWASVDHKVRMTWAKEINKSSQWGKSIRLRIHLRRTLGRDPTDNEYDEHMLDNNDYRQITPEDVTEALLQGEESVAVWVMKCVGYEAEFQQEIARKWRDWVPPPPRKKGKKGEKPKKETKRKREEVEASDEEAKEGEDDELAEEQESAGEQEELVYRHKGTRRRPIHLE